jgi:hypothetical protein
MIEELFAVAQSDLPDMAVSSSSQLHPPAKKLFESRTLRIY